MKLLIDPSGGIAGDMFSAALISAGASDELMLGYMKKAAAKLGNSMITIQTTDDGATQLNIKLEANHHHLEGEKARQIVLGLCKELNFDEKYVRLGEKMIDILLAAEKKAHSEHTFLVDHHHHGDKTYLHEAQDIIIDIIGAIGGMQLLNLETTAEITQPVNYGGGTVTFSHGTLPVPAPATQIIFDKYQIPNEKGTVETELCTPTGAAILAALDVKLTKSSKSKAIGFSRGTKILDIPPLKLMLRE